MSEVDKLWEEVKRRADAATPQLLSKVYDMLYSRHLSGYGGDCTCSYCRGLSAYIRAKVVFHRARSRQWKYDWDDPKQLEVLERRFRELARQHRIDSELFGSFRPARIRYRSAKTHLKGFDPQESGQHFPQDGYR